MAWASPLQCGHIDMIKIKTILFAGTGLVVIALSGLLAFQTFQLKNKVAENKNLEMSLANARSTIKTMGKAENLAREWSENSMREKTLLKNKLDTAVNLIEGERNENPVDGDLFDGIVRLYGNP